MYRVTMKKRKGCNSIGKGKYVYRSDFANQEEEIAVCRETGKWVYRCYIECTVMADTDSGCDRSMEYTEYKAPDVDSAVLFGNKLIGFVRRVSPFEFVLLDELSLNSGHYGFVIKPLEKQENKQEPEVKQKHRQDVNSHNDLVRTCVRTQNDEINAYNDILCYWAIERTRRRYIKSDTPEGCDWVCDITENLPLDVYASYFDEKFKELVAYSWGGHTFYAGESDSFENEDGIFRLVNGFYFAYDIS